jgi:methionyl-tRNA formyltransferase
MAGEIPPAPWRVVIVSQIAQVAAGYAQILRACGHEPVAHFAVRRARRDEAPPPAAELFLSRLLFEGPQEIPLVFPPTRRAPADLLRSFAPDLVLCTGFPWRIPAAALAVPALGWMNGHPSLLPEYRGPTPMAWAVRNGEAEIGLTYHRMDEDFDTGAILAQGSVPLDEEDTLLTLNDKFAPLAAQLLPAALERVARGEVGDVQEGGSYQSLFDDDYVAIDTSQPAGDVHRQVRAWSFAPFALGERGPILDLGGVRRRVLRTSLAEVDGAERVECGDGPLWIVESEPA